IGQTGPAFQESQLHDDRDSGDDRPRRADEIDCGTHGPTSGQDVVDDQDPVALDEGVTMDLDGRLAVFQLVGRRRRGSWQLSGFAYRHETRPEPIRYRGAENESPGFDSGHDVRRVAGRS